MRKKIAVFANGYGIDTLKPMLRGFRAVDADNGYDFFVFISYASYDEYEDFNKGELNIYKLPDLSWFDGAIVSTNSLNSVETGIEMVETALKANIPVVSIGIEVEGAINVNIDNVTGIKELSEHLINDHHVGRAVLIGGYEQHPESICRIDTVKKVFAEHGIPIPDEDIYYGNWGSIKTVEIAKQIAEDPRGLPDAIIAMNDIMALACSTELTQLGYNIPEDVIVTGYDFISKGQVYYPVLTTVDSDFETMGKECYRIFNDVFAGRDYDKTLMLRSHPVISESCGCCSDGTYDKKRRDYGKNTYLEVLDRESLETSERTLTKLITDSGDYGTLRKKLVEYYTNDRDFVGDDFHVVIHDKYFFDVMADDEDVFEDCPDGNDMQALVSIIGGEVHTGAAAGRNALVPGYDPDRTRSHIYYLIPLHTGIYNFGYIVTADDAKIMRQHLDLHSYIEKFMLAFRIQRSNIQLKIYNDSLRRISEIDTMTGLFNRLGYENKATPIYEACKTNGTRLMVMFIDINRMKRINDIFGHMNGDAAIRMTASAIKSNLRPHWIAVRFGGDEFLVIGSVKNEEEAEAYRSDILASVERFNSEGTWPFRLSVSCGYIISEEGEHKPLADYIKEADNLMYETKKKMHSEKHE